MKRNKNPQKRLKDIRSTGIMLLMILFMSLLFNVINQRPLFEKPQMYITGAVFLAGIGCIWFSSIKLQQLTKLYERYLSNIFDSHMYSYLELAQMENLSIETVRDDLKVMIEQNLLMDIELDDFNRQVVLIKSLDDQHAPSDEEPEDNHKYEASSGDCCEDPEPEKDPEPTTVECPSCGSPATLPKGQRKSCEYCGHKIVIKEGQSGSSE